MNKKSIFSSIIIVMIMGMITKFISMVSRIIISRELGLEAVSLNSLVNPLFVFAITLASFSLPTVISTLVSKHPNKAKNIFFSSLAIIIIFNFIFIIIISLFKDFIAQNLLHNEDTKYSISLLAIVVPLTTISSIIKGYYMGKKELILTSESSLIEECSRLISIIILVNLFSNSHSSIKATFFILVMIIGEIVQTSYLLLSSGKKYLKNIAKIKGFLDISNHSFSPVLSLAVPLTFSRIITSFTYMLEPIILTTLLSHNNSLDNDVTLAYGVLSSYVMPLLLFPGFFSTSIANYLLPNLSSLIAQDKYREGQKLFNNSLLLSLLIGLFFSLTFFIFGDKILYLIYHIEAGNNEIKILSIPFIIYYIEAPINIAMHALNQSKAAFKSSFIASFLRILLLIILLKYLNVFAVAVATLVSCYIDVLINYLTICRIFKRNNVKTIF